MRAAGIVKIVIGSVLVVVLVSIMLGVVGGRFVWDSLGIEERVRMEILEHLPEGVRSSDSDSGAVAVGSTSFAAADVREIDVEWISGKVELSVTDGEELLVSESSATTLSDAQKMRCSLSDGKLKIAYCDDLRNVWQWFLRGGYWVPDKTLYLEVPASLMAALEELDLETVSASVRIDAAEAACKELDVSSTSGRIVIMNLVAKSLSASSVSGSISLENCSADGLDLETVSGRMEAKGGDFGRIEVESVSGSAELACLTAPKQLNAETVSGRVRVWLPADAEFTARLSSVSGKLSSEIPGLMSQNQLTSGSGANRYTFESVSGNVELLINP